MTDPGLCPQCGRELRTLGDGTCTSCGWRPQVWTVEAVVEFVRRRFGTSSEGRAAYLSDPGGYLAYVWPADSPAPPDEIARLAIARIAREWGRSDCYRCAGSGIIPTGDPESPVAAGCPDCGGLGYRS